MNFNVLSININDLNDHRKGTAFIDCLHCMRVDVVCLQETHAPSHESIRWWFRNSGFHAASSCFTNKSGGTAILVKDNYKIDKIIRDDAGRFVQALVSLGDESLSFISLYAPNRNLARNTFFTSLTALIDLTRPVFVARDFNSVLDSALDRKRRPSFTDSASARGQESGPALEALMSFTQTYPLWCTLHPQCIAYSWTHGSGEFASRIDMIWAPTVMQDCIQECNYFPSFFLDHQYLFVKCNFRDPIIAGWGVWKLNTSLLQDPEYVSLVKSFWSFWETYKDHEDFASLLDWWDQGKFYLREVTRSYSKSKAAQQRSTKASLLKRMRELQALFEAGDQASFAALCQVQQELRRIALSWRPSLCSLSVGGGRRDFFLFLLKSGHKEACKTSHAVNQGSQHGCVVCHDPFAIVGVWRTYYKDLFTATQCHPVAQDELLAKLTRRLDKTERASCEGCLTVDECFQALMGMSRSKTPGSDGFPMEFYFTFWDALGADLVRVLNHAFETGQLSTSQRRGLIIVLYKRRSFGDQELAAYKSSKCRL